jgi:hypothetical protein
MGEATNLSLFQQKQAERLHSFGRKDAILLIPTHPKGRNKQRDHKSRRPLAVCLV